MRKILLGIIFFTFSIFGGLAHAITPESGWWWNPSASGSGYNLEIQNNVLFVAVYAFEPTGAPLYYASAGTMVGDRKYSGSLLRYSNGQCINCAYQAPVSAPFGTISIDFDSPTTASISINGGVATRIQRFGFGTDTSQATGMLGEWTIVQGSITFPVYYGERIRFAGTQISNQKLIATGYRSGATSSLAVASPNGDGTWSILLDSSTSYYQYFNFRFSGINTIEGNSWTYLKTSSLSGSGTPFIGFRSLSASFVINGTGPGVSKLEVVRGVESTREMELRDQVQSLSQEKSDEPIDSLILNAEMKAKLSLMEISR